MRVLLDTHALIWYCLDDPKLGQAARAIIEHPEHEKFVSPASFREVAIKMSRRQYLLNVPSEEFIQAAIFANGFAILAIEPRHTAAIVALPRHHNGPFDRLLIAQAMVEGMPIVSVDGQFDAYPIARPW